MVSRPVVQSLGSQEVLDLGEALRQLARRPRDLSALLAAGNASLGVDDLDAAMGFFGRAEEVAPQDRRVKFGMASVFLRSGRPVPALQLFDEIAASGLRLQGAEAATFQRDRGLAYDLVGETAKAQADYKAALSANAKDGEVISRLAISQAIAGDEAGFEDTLRPLLAQSNPAAFRTRAFGLAILNQQDRASAIVNEVMPRDLASRLTPYLAFMPRLTPAQQAAAANLGIFPRAADIGREDPAIAQYRAGGPSIPGNGGGPVPATQVAGIDSKLAPAGAPLGSEEGAAPSQLSQTGPTVVYSSASAPIPDARGPAVQSSAPVEPKPSVEDAFSDLRDGSGTQVARADAVDLNSIEVPREANRDAAPKPPAAPRRFWVQVATGRDVSALGFDWRRIKRRASGILAPFDAHVTPWGEANRLLAGPVESAAKAREIVNDLKVKGLDSFTYTSPEGTEIKTLDAR